MTDPIPDPYVWPPTIELRRGPDSVATHAAALRRVMGESAHPDCGIVYVGGGRYWPGIVAGVRMLRDTGCDLPVEVWHRGDLEPVNPEDVAGLGVRLVDSLAMARVLGDDRVTHTPHSGGWESKLYALTHTRFDRVLFLDADAYCVANPRPLFDTLTQTRPFVFWEDMPRMRDSVKWARIMPELSRDVPPVQGGQLLIDTRHARATLRVAHWMCQHSDFYFAHVYGDQDCWRVALAGNTDYARSLGPAEWRGVAFVCSHRATEYIVHRCQSKLFEDAPGPRDDSLPGENRVWAHFLSVTK